MLNEGNQIHNFMSSSGSGSVINKLQFRFRFRFQESKSYGSYGSGSGSGSTTLLGIPVCEELNKTNHWHKNTPYSTPPPSPPVGECVPSPFGSRGGGTHPLAGERMGRGPISDVRTDTVVYSICTYWAHTIRLPQKISCRYSVHAITWLFLLQL